MSFEKFYDFSDGAEIVIKNTDDGKKFLRVDDDTPKNINWQGGKGALAQWKIHVKEDWVQLESLRTGKFLRCFPKQGGKLDAAVGPDGDRTHFMLIKIGDGIVILRSHPTDDDGKHVLIGSMPLRILMKGKNRDSFRKPYKFLNENKVVIQHHTGKHFRAVKREISEGGGFGKFAHFQIFPEEDGKQCRIKALEDGNDNGWLRIKADKETIDCAGNEKGNWTYFKVHRAFDDDDELTHVVHLESVKFPGHFLGCNDKGVKVITKKWPTSRLTVWREN